MSHSQREDSLSPETGFEIGLNGDVRANYELARTTADCWQFLVKSNSVSKQETDQAVANQAAQKAVVDSNSVNVRRLQQLQSFEKVYAPFDGVITARSTGIGALIDASSSAQRRAKYRR